VADLELDHLVLGAGFHDDVEDLGQAAGIDDVAFEQHGLADNWRLGHSVDGRGIDLTRRGSLVSSAESLG